MQMAISPVAGGNTWRVVAVGDYDGDHRDDIFWRNFSTGANAVWKAGNVAAGLPVSAVASQAWQVVP
jgi:hypothetical protein